MSKHLPLLLLFLCVGCGATCPLPERLPARDMAPEPLTESPHAMASIPLALLDELIAPELARLPAMRVKLPLPGPLGAAAGTLRLRVQRVWFRPAPPGRIGVTVEVGLESGGDTLLALTIKTQVKLHLDVPHSKVRFAVGADDLKSVQPAVSKQATNALADHLRASLPPAARRLFSRKQARAAARKLVTTLLEREYPAVGSRLLAPLGEIVEFDWQLPDVPLRKLTLTSAKGPPASLELTAWSSLPVPEGLAAAPGHPRRNTTRVSLRVAGGLLAALANDAMATGRLPDRYTAAGKPAPEGEYHPFLRWAQGPRTLQLLLWKTDPPCGTVLLAGIPRVRIRNGSLALAATDMRIQETTGSAALRVGAWLHRVWNGALNVSAQTAAGTQLTVAGARLDLQVVGAETHNDGLELDIELRRRAARQTR